jgi:hypothetical protein
MKEDASMLAMFMGDVRCCLVHTYRALIPGCEGCAGWGAPDTLPWGWIDPYKRYCSVLARLGDAVPQARPGLARDHPAWRECACVVAVLYLL